MKNKLMTLALACFVSTPVLAQEAVPTALPSVVTPEATAPATTTDSSPLLSGNHTINYDLNSLKPVGSLPVNDTPLNLPHISKAEVLNWTMTTITDVMTNNAQGLTASLERNKSKFTDEGYEDLIAFLRTNRITNANLIDNKNISVINLQTPAVINEGDVQGTYRWLMSIQLIVSKIDPTIAASISTESARRKLMDEMAKNNSEHILRVQVVRLKEPNDTPYNTAIEMIEEEKPVVKKEEPKK